MGCWDYDLEGNATHKTCTACKQVKVIEEFPLDKYKRDGHKPHCALCHASKNQARRDENPHWHPAIQENYRAKQLGKEGRVSPAERELVWDRCGGMCIRCNSRKDLELDHIVPLNAGGEHIEFNLQVLCKSCNSFKGDRLEEDIEGWVK